ncbi:MAG: ribulose-phosphate 3-epimerase [Candidatus Yanofskybacteria bacterium]|nr:ribulose-phosphate 3-epimerase [Candidatus Yanofskybacteria bacterium]
MIEIIPAILVKNREELLEKIAAMEAHAERVHLDIADGIFVPNMTILGFEEMESLDTNLKFEVHLMVSKPENHIVRWLETPADKFIFHIEATNKSQEVIDAVKEADKTIGIALNPQTPIAKIEPFIDQIDFVHFMTVEPGFYGGKFVDTVIDKIKDFHFYYPDKTVEVDGGITPETAPKLIEAGVNMFVVGSYIWEGKDQAEAIKKLKEITK